MSYNEALAPTQVLVPGRGHQVEPDGRLGLTDSAIARVETARDYYQGHAERFEAETGLIVFEGGWAATATGMAKPPEKLREGRLMRDLGTELGIPENRTVAGIESTSTLDNCLKQWKTFRNAGSLAIVTQLAQADRLLLCAEKVWPGKDVTIVEAPGEEDPEIIETEQDILQKSRMLYGLAKGPAIIRINELRILDKASMVLGRLSGMRPGAEYGAAAS